MLARMLPTQMGSGLGARPSLDLRAKCSCLHQTNMLQAEVQTIRAPLMEGVNSRPAPGV